MDGSEQPPPKLPRVSPENLVEGEWYVVDTSDLGTFFDERNIARFHDGYLYVCGSEIDEKARDFKAIWGPLPKFRLEES